MWKEIYSKEALDDLKQLDNHQRRIVQKAILKVLQNPLPFTEGGLGIPLGNKYDYNLTGYCEIKLRGLGIRVIYQCLKDDMIVKMIVIDKRSDQEVYKEAHSRINN